MLIPPLPRVPNLSPTRFMYGIWQNLLGNTSFKLPQLPRDPNICPTTLLNAIWEATKNGVGGLPNQTGNAGKFLTTDGTTVSWMAVPGGGDMLAAVYDPAGVAAQLAGASGEAINAAAFRTALGATVVGSSVFLAANTAAAISGLGATTVGGNFFTLANPGAITFPRINADNTVTARSAADFRGDIGAGTSSFSGAWGALTGRPANVDAFAALANAAGVLTNNGAGVFSYTATSTGANGAADSGKLAVFSVNGELASTTSMSVLTAGTQFATYLGNSIVFSNGGFSHTIVPQAIAANRTFTLPSATGTLALTSDIPAAPSSIVGISGTMAQFDTACTDGDFAFIGAANVFTAANTFSVNGAASNPAIKLSGTWFAGGSATTTKPQLLIEQSGATTNSWSTNGTGLGVNGPSGFTGNLFDVKDDGTTKFRIAPGTTGVYSTVSIYCPQANITGGYIGLGSAQQIYLLANGGLGDGNLRMTNAAENGFGRLCFGPATNGFSAIKANTTTLQCRLADDSAYATFDALAYKVGGTAGVTVGPLTAITGITVVGGIVTALTGT